jgi:cytochrome c-type biogenesis protein CcmH
MVAGMVGQLDARLTAEGGSPEEWARLVSSYAVMGKLEEARGALDRARTALKDQPEAVKIVEAAATDAGITR